MRVFHLAMKADWDEAVRTGRYQVSTRGMTLDEITPGEVAEVLGLEVRAGG